MPTAAPRRTGIFSSLESPELAALLAVAPILELEAGAVRSPAALESAAMVLVESGLAVIRAEQPGTLRAVVVCHVGAGALTLPPLPGEQLLALVPTQAMVFTDELRDRALEIPGAAPLLFEALAASIRQKHRTIEALAHPHHLDRVRAKLLQLAADHGIVAPDGVRLDFPLTHELLGEMTGSARETVTRAIDQLQAEGLLQRRGRSYRLVVDPDGLAT